MDATEFLIAAFHEALAEVIEHYAGETPQVSAKPAGPTGAGAVVGFADERVKGSCLLTADPDTLRRLSPGGEADPLDWLGELNNQVVGRLKNKAVPAGLLFQLSPPVTAAGPEVRFRASLSSNTHWAAEWAGGRLGAMLALSVPAGLTLVADEATVVAEEGSLNLF